MKDLKFMESLNEKIIPLRIKSKGSMRGNCMRSEGVREKVKKQSFNFFLGIGAWNYLSISTVLLSQLSVFFFFLCSLSLFFCFPFLFSLSLSSFGVFFFFFERLLAKTSTSTTKISTKEDTKPFAARFDAYLSLQTFSL